MGNMTTIQQHTRGGKFVYIPAALADCLEFKKGLKVKFTVRGKGLSLQPVENTSAGTYDDPKEEVCPNIEPDKYEEAVKNHPLTKAMSGLV